MRTTNKIVIQKLHDHIADYFKKSAGWDTDDWKSNLKEQVNAMRYGNRSDYQIGIDIAEGGTFLVYYVDVDMFIKSLELSAPQGAIYSDDKTWRLYCHLLAREIAKIVNEG